MTTKSTPAPVDAATLSAEGFSYLEPAEQEAAEKLETKIRDQLTTNRGHFTDKLPTGKSEKRIMVIVCNRYANAGWDVYHAQDAVVVQHPMLRMPHARTRD